MAESGTWERRSVRTAGGNRTVRYVNTQSGESISRRQYEKRTNPTKYQQYYASDRKSGQKYKSYIAAKHPSKGRIYTVESVDEIRGVLAHNRGTRADVTVVITVHGKDQNGNQVQFNTDNFAAEGSRWIDDAVNDVQRVLNQYRIQTPERFDIWFITGLTSRERATQKKRQATRRRQSGRR